MRAIEGETHLWGAVEQLTAAVVDELRVANWQRAGGKRKDYPKPIPRPGVTDDSSTVVGSDPLPLDEMDAWLGWETSLLE